MRIYLAIVESKERLLKVPEVNYFHDVFIVEYDCIFIISQDTVNTEFDWVLKHRSLGLTIVPESQLF